MISILYVNVVNTVTYTTPFADESIIEQLDPAVVPYVASGENVSETYELDANYYSENLETILEDFNRWLIQ